jgi:quinol monooxygenase YgiN
MATWHRRAIQSHEGHSLLKLAVARKFLGLIVLALLLASPDDVSATEQHMMVRIAEIQVEANYLKQYKAILNEEAEASVRLEPGVIAIVPMYQTENATAFSILEIYASREAYESHLKTPHFQHYKSATLHMVKSLKLVDMQVLDAQTMTRIFAKTKGHK